MKPKKVKTFSTKKCKNNKTSNEIEILNSSDPELQHKDTESAIKNKLKKLLSELKGFKSVITLVLVLKKIESEDKNKI